MRVDPSREVSSGQSPAASNIGVSSKGVPDLSETCFYRFGSQAELLHEAVRTINSGFAEKIAARDFSGAIELLENYRDRIVGRPGCPASIVIPFHLKLAYAYLLSERPYEAEGELLEAGRLCQSEAVGSRYLAETLDRLALSSLLQGKPEAARNQYRLALEESAKVPGAEFRIPRITEHDEELFTSSRRADAVKIFRGLAQDQNETDHLSERSMWPKYQLGKFLLDSGSIAEGEKFIRAAHEIAKRIQGELEESGNEQDYKISIDRLDPALIEIQGTLIELLVEEGRIEESFPLLINQIELLQPPQRDGLSPRRLPSQEPELDERIVKPVVFLALYHMLHGKVSEANRSLAIAAFVERDQKNVPSPIQILMVLAAGYSMRKIEELPFAAMRLAVHYANNF